MTANFRKHELKKVKVPVVEMNKHKERLRRALLTSSHWDGRSSLVNMKYKRLALSGAVVAVLAIGLFTKVGIDSGSFAAYAKEIAKKGMQTVSRLSTEQEKALEERFKADTDTLLNEALKAPDLRVLTYDQFEKLAGSKKQRLEMRRQGILMEDPTLEKDPAELKQAKFLLFTGSQGGLVFIGFSEDNLPLIIREAVRRFDESPSEPAPGLVKGGDHFETVGNAVRGRTTIFSDTELDPGPSGVVAWLRVQEANSGLKPLGDHKGSWLGEWEQKNVEIKGAPVTLEYNVDTGTFEGKPFHQTWLKVAWTKDGKEYQMFGHNITVDDFVRMANSVK